MVNLVINELPTDVDSRCDRTYASLWFRAPAVPGKKAAYRLPFRRGTLYKSYMIVDAINHRLAVAFWENFL
jgi:hypothetical protein